MGRQGVGVVLALGLLGLLGVGAAVVLARPAGPPPGEPPGDRPEFNVSFSFRPETGTVAAAAPARVARRWG